MTSQGAAVKKSTAAAWLFLMCSKLLLLQMCSVGSHQRRHDEHLRLGYGGTRRRWILGNEHPSRDLALIGFDKGEGRAIHGIENEAESTVQGTAGAIAGGGYDLTPAVNRCDVGAAKRQTIGWSPGGGIVFVDHAGYSSSTAVGGELGDVIHFDRGPGRSIRAREVESVALRRGKGRAGGLQIGCAGGDAGIVDF